MDILFPPSSSPSPPISAFHPPYLLSHTLVLYATNFLKWASQQTVTFQWLCMWGNQFPDWIYFSITTYFLVKVVPLTVVVWGLCTLGLQTAPQFVHWAWRLPHNLYTGPADCPTIYKLGLQTAPQFRAFSAVYYLKLKKCIPQFCLKHSDMIIKVPSLYFYPRLIICDYLWKAFWVSFKTLL